MKQPILKIGFTHYSDSDLEDKADTILESLTGSLTYPSPGPSTLADLTTTRDAFSLVKAQRGRIPNYRALKKLRRNELIFVMKNIGIYVRDTTPGDVVLWLTSGYDVQTFEGDVHVPPTPVNLQVKDGIYTGTMEVTYNESKDALWYEGQLIVNGEVLQITEPITSSKLKMIFTGLTKGTEYGFRVRAHGTKGVSGWSQPVFRVSQ